MRFMAQYSKPAMGNKGKNPNSSYQVKSPVKVSVMHVPSHEGKKSLKDLSAKNC
jgi:hypothetical protein